MRCHQYNSVRVLSDKVSALISRNELDQALKLIHDFVERIITEPLCNSQVYGSKTLDDLCQRIGKANLAGIRREIADAALSRREQPVFARIQS